MKRYNASSKKILGIGNALIDTLVRVPDEGLLQEFGLSKGCMTLIDETQCLALVKSISGMERTETVGGSAANTIRGIASLKSPCGYVGKVGVDEAGSFYRWNMERLGIIPQLLTGSRPSGRSICLITPDGERTMATYLGAAQDLATDDFAAKMFNGYEYLHIEGYLVQNLEMIERVLQLAKEAGLCISMDLSSPNVVAANLKVMRDLVSIYVDIILANEEEALVFTETTTPREALLVLSAYSKIAAIKLGSKGSLISYQHTHYLIPARLADCVDTTGAGDLYAAGFLYGVIHSLGLETCGKIAALLASNVIEVVGATIPNNKWTSIRRAIRRLEA